ncbi:MAG: FecR family protein [Acidobacteriia bacterium]|nr:FecR family protein [Terriglobia bacterium]
MAFRRFRFVTFLIAAGMWLVPVAHAAQQGLSHVRVVRLSYIQGTVAVKRPGATEWAKALVNTPIQEGFELSTSANSYAEVQFENGSTARVGELSKLQFSQLALAADGSKLNHLTLSDGYATFHFMPERGDDYSVVVAGTTLTPRGKSEFRSDLEADHLRVEVFNGSVDVATPSKSVRLGKDKILDVNVQTNEALNTHGGIEKDDWDKWVEARDAQSTLSYRDQAYGPKRPFYGWDDLGAYGDWGFFPGYGYGWSPYTSLGWSPYSAGMWNWYPSFGWTWISGEPWGWVPFHYGSWAFDASFGWFWMPGAMGMWSPAMVSWYQGPGWIGWAPAGVGAVSACNCLTAVPTGVIQNGGTVGRGDVIRVKPGEIRAVSAPSFLPSQSAMLSGTPLGSHPVMPGVVTAAGGQVATTGTVRTSVSGPNVGTAATARGTFATRVQSRPAPATVLMGNSVAAERSAMSSNRGFMGRAGRFFSGSEAQPLQIQRSGNTTLGGHTPVAEAERGMGARTFGGASGVSRGQVSNRSMGRQTSPGSARSGPVMLSHGGGRSSGGSSSMSSHSGGGGFSGGGGGVRSTATSTSTSSAGHASSGTHR